MSEFGRLVGESLILFKTGQTDECHDKLAEAFELSWEDGIKVDKQFANTVLLGLKMWFRTQSRTDSLDELLHALELFPEEVELWRHLVDTLSSNEDVNPKAVQVAWKGLNERVLLPERVDVLARSFARMGDVDKARELCPEVEWMEPVAELVEQPSSEFKLPFSDITPNGYATMLLRLYESIVSGQKGKLDSVFAPIVFSFDPNSVVLANNSPPDSTPQSSQDVSQVNSPAKKRRPVRQIARRRSQDLDRISPKVTLPDLLSELFPIEIGQWWQSNQALTILKAHLIKMNEQRACLMTRVVEFCKQDCLESVSYRTLQKLLLVAVEDMNCRDYEILQNCAIFIPLSMPQSLTPDPETLGSMLECYKIFTEANENIKSQNLTMAKSIVDQIDYTACLNDDNVHGELKHLIVHVLCLLDIEFDYMSMVNKYGGQFWMPFEELVPHCATMDPVLAAKLLLTNTELPAPHLLLNIVKCDQAQLIMERLLDYLDQNAMLMSNNAALAGELLSIVERDQKDVAWNLFRAMYRLPMALSINSKFSSDPTFTAAPTIGHTRDIFKLIEYYWSEEDEKLNVAETEDLLRWLLESIQLPTITRRLVDLNINSLRSTLRTFTQEIPSLIMPKQSALPVCEELKVFKSVVDLLYRVQSDQFVNKRRSPDWLHSYKHNLKLHWSLFNTPNTLSDLALCFHALCKYSVTSFEAASLSTLLPKLKRKLKRSLICFELSNSRVLERLEVLEYILQPGLLQFGNLEDEVRLPLLQTFVSLVRVALEREGEWRWWYLLAEAMYSVNPQAAIPPLRAALKASENDAEAQCIIYQLYFQCRPLNAETMSQLTVKVEELEKANNIHRLVYCKFLLSTDNADKENALSALLPFLAKPRVSGLSNLKQSQHDRPGDYYHLQERYVMSAIDYYNQNTPLLLQIAQRVKTCGTHHLLAPDAVILACAEHACSVDLGAEDRKKMLSFLRDMPKGERRDAVMKRLAVGSDVIVDKSDKMDKTDRIGQIDA